MTLYPAATYLPVPSHSGLMTQHLGLILHVQQGDGGLRGEFADPARQKSATWWVSKTGVVEQYVDADLVAWAQANGNHDYNSVETEGFPNEPLTDAQVAALADLYSWGHQTYGWPLALAETPGEPGFGWHGMGGSLWGGHPFCPGDIRKAQRATILARVIGPTTGGNDVQVQTLQNGDTATAVAALRCILNGYMAAAGMPRSAHNPLSTDGPDSHVFDANVQGALQDLEKHWAANGVLEAVAPANFGKCTPFIWWLLLGKQGPDPTKG